ncbi:TRAP transporter small permease [Chelativorans sp. M5D2P16]|uniref:TRAP transporter small permease n=1 Tax=Chelativorans sp. M5D2P16 TaxID=3095678 RepID=UPI002ACA8B19|nr:TRAP transporter small permease [Chelativorans sp. M5D2P16]MDZ5699640.1 TRAP transporter small permease [Chelativorans sp. M5D2P16]
MLKDNRLEDRESGLPGLVERFLDRLADLCHWFAGVLLVLLIGIFGWLVYGRYVLNDTPTWVEQASLIIVVYVTFLGAAVGIRRDAHLSIDFIREAMPPLPRAVLRLVSDLAMIAFGCFMAWQGWHLVMTNLHRKIPLLGLTESWRAAPLAICGVLTVLFVAASLYRRWRTPGR